MTFPARTFSDPLIEILRGRAFPAQGNESAVTSDLEDYDAGLVEGVNGGRGDGGAHTFIASARLQREFTEPQRTGGIGGSPRARLHNSRHRPAAGGSAPPCGGIFRPTRRVA